MPMQKKFRRGFTLIELTMVIVLVAVLSAVFFIRYTGSTDFVLDNASKRMASDLRYMRSLAVNMSMPHGITFLKNNPADPPFFAYQPRYRDDTGTKDYEDPARIRPVILEEQYGADLDGTVYRSEGTDPVGEIVFSFDGKPYSGFGMQDLFKDYVRITFFRGSKQKTVVVYPNSGEVKIE